MRLHPRLNIMEATEIFSIISDLEEFQIIIKSPMRL
jgi:hypothetical protein